MLGIHEASTTLSMGFLAIQDTMLSVVDASWIHSMFEQFDAKRGLAALLPSAFFWVLNPPSNLCVYFEVYPDAFYDVKTP